MHSHEIQQFEILLATAVERFVERLEQRNGGTEHALNRLRYEPEGEGVWLRQFTAMLFVDFLLDNAAGACFVLQALADRTAPPVPSGAIGTVLQQMAVNAFAELLQQKTEEVLEQRIAYQSV
jgi:hypothetical protein